MTYLDSSSMNAQPGTPIESRPKGEDDPEEQWFFQFHEHLLLTVQAIYRLRVALASRMP
jgi:hypothetical protein